MIVVTRHEKCKIRKSTFDVLVRKINENYELKFIEGSCAECGNHRIVQTHDSKVKYDQSAKRFRWMPCWVCLRANHR